MNLQESTYSSPAIIVGEEDEHRELEKPLHTVALIRFEVDEAIGGRPSTGAAPQPLQLLDLSSLLTTAAAEERTSHIYPTSIPTPTTSFALLTEKAGNISICQRRRLTSLDSCTRLPDLVISAKVDLHRGEEEVRRIYSMPPLPLLPHRRRLERQDTEVRCLLD